MTDKQLCKYLYKEAEDSKKAVTFERLDELMERKLRINMDKRMPIRGCRVGLQTYHSILSQNGVKWIIKENQKLAVTYVLSAIRPQSLHKQLESHVSLSHQELKKDFKKFLTHTVKLSEDFQIVNSGPKKKTKKQNDNRFGNPGGSSENNGKDKEKVREQPLCLWEPHRKAWIRHLPWNCKECPEDDKSRLREQITTDKSKTRSVKSTRSQLSKDYEQKKISANPTKDIWKTVKHACFFSVLHHTQR